MRTGRCNASHGFRPAGPAKTPKRARAVTAILIMRQMLRPVRSYAYLGGHSSIGGPRKCLSLGKPGAHSRSPRPAWFGNYVTPQAALRYRPGPKSAPSICFGGGRGVARLGLEWSKHRRTGHRRSKRRSTGRLETNWACPVLLGSTPSGRVCVDVVHRRSRPRAWSCRRENARGRTPAASRPGTRPGRQSRFR